MNKDTCQRCKINPVADLWDLPLCEHCLEPDLKWLLSPYENRVMFYSEPMTACVRVPSQSIRAVLP